jgi:hypothetical protein
LGSVPASAQPEAAAVEVLVAPTAIAVSASGTGVPATIVENRDLGSLRRIQARLHSSGELLFILADYQGLGEVSLALAGRDTHIFATPPSRRM